MQEILIKFINNPKFLLFVVCLLIILLLIQSIRLYSKKTSLRSDAIKRSKAVIGGQVVEQVAPFLPGFPCNPSDARFIGKPVDFIAFSGLSKSDCVDEVLFIEVKTGQSKLNNHEREIKKAIEQGRVRYVEWRKDD